MKWVHAVRGDIIIFLSNYHFTKYENADGLKCIQENTDLMAN